MISSLAEGTAEVVGLILTLDELQNWGPGSYTTVSDVLIDSKFLEDIGNSEVEASRTFLLSIYLKFFMWLKEK